MDEIKAKGLGIFAVCAQEQNDVDQMMNDYNLQFKVNRYRHKLWTDSINMYM